MRTYVRASIRRLAATAILHSVPIDILYKYKLFWYVYVRTIKQKYLHDKIKHRNGIFTSLTLVRFKWDTFFFSSGNGFIRFVLKVFFSIVVELSMRKRKKKTATPHTTAKQRERERARDREREIGLFFRTPRVWTHAWYVKSKMKHIRTLHTVHIIPHHSPYLLYILRISYWITFLLF